MTKQIEVLDALPGCGKTYAAFQHIADNPGKPWLYLTPTLAELKTRVPEECTKKILVFNILGEDTEDKSEEVLKAFKNRENVACTHALMLRFQDRHIEEIVKGEYQVVCDEELNLISNFPITKQDSDFLLAHKLIEVSEDDGKVTFTDKDMSLDAKYGDVKQLADMGCLYAAKRKQSMLVTQISPRLINAADRFILLTYQYKGSIMQTFMEMQGYKHKELNLPLKKTPKEIVQGLNNLIEFIETPSVKAVQRKHSLSKSWWDVTSTEKDREEVTKAIRSVIKASKESIENVIYTLPKNRVHKGNKTLIKTEYIRKDNFLSCSTRSTCEYEYKSLAIHAYALYPPQAVKAYLQDMGHTVDDDVYALNMLIQWLFRTRIRNDEPVKVSLLSKKMNVLFKTWLLESMK